MELNRRQAVKLGAGTGIVAWTAPVVLAKDLAVADASAICTEVYRQDFSAGNDGNWSPYRETSLPAPYGTALGPFTGAVQGSTLTLTGLPAHSEIRIEFQLLLIDSWDGNHGSFGPDLWTFTNADGTTFRTTFSQFPTHTTHKQSYPDQYPGGNHPGQTGAAQTWSGGSADNFAGNGYGDSRYEMAFAAPHSAPSASFGFHSENLTDEWWAMDDVVVTVC